MPSIGHHQQPDAGEETVQIGSAAATLHPGMPPSDPILYAWMGQYEVRATEEGVPVVVPKLVPYTMSGGVAGMKQIRGQLADFSGARAAIEKSGGVVILHRSLPSHIRRRRVHSADPARPAYRHYSAWESMVQDRRGRWSIHHDESAYVDYLLSLYPGGAVPGGLVPYPSDADLDAIRETRERRILKHLNEVDARDSLALAEERAQKAREEKAFSAIADKTSPPDRRAADTIEVIDVG